MALTPLIKHLSSQRGGTEHRTGSQGIKQTKRQCGGSTPSMLPNRAGLTTVLFLRYAFGEDFRR